MPVLVKDIPLKTVCALPAIPQAVGTVSLVPVPQQEPLQLVDNVHHLSHTVECICTGLWLHKADNTLARNGKNLW